MEELKEVAEKRGLTNSLSHGQRKTPSLSSTSVRSSRRRSALARAEFSSFGVANTSVARPWRRCRREQMLYFPRTLSRPAGSL